jgi:hypothetical protein
VLPFLLGACATDDFDVSVQQMDDPGTVAIVSWSTSAAGNAWIEYGLTRELGASTPVGSESETDHTVLLAGLPADETVFWRAFTNADGDVMSSGVQRMETGPPPRGTPGIDVHDDGDPSLAAPGFSLTSSLNDALVLMYDADGHLVWWHQGNDDTVLSQVRMGRDGRSVVYNEANIDFGTDTSQLVRVGLDGQELETIRTPLGHHDFVELDDGTFAYLAIDVRTWVDEHGTSWPVVGDAVTEVGADGETRVVWSTWDDLDVVVDTTDETDIYPQGLDWTHANSLVYEADDDAYLVSLHNLSTLAHVDRATGSVDWRLGGDRSDFTLTSGAGFTHEHSPEWLPDGGLLLFNNGDVAGGGDAYSQASEYAVDLGARTYAERWHYDADQRHATFLLGDADRLDNGDTLVSFGNAGVISEVTADGDPAFEYHLDVGHAYGFSHHVAALGGRW